MKNINLKFLQFFLLFNSIESNNDIKNVEIGQKISIQNNNIDKNTTEQEIISLENQLTLLKKDTKTNWISCLMMLPPVILICFNVMLLLIFENKDNLQNCTIILSNVTVYNLCFLFNFFCCSYNKFDVNINKIFLCIAALSSVGWIGMAWQDYQIEDNSIIFIIVGLIQTVSSYYWHNRMNKFYSLKKVKKDLEILKTALKNELKQ